MVSVIPHVPSASHPKHPLALFFLASLLALKLEPPGTKLLHRYVSMVDIETKNFISRCSSGVEQLIRNEQVVGSNPTSGSID